MRVTPHKRPTITDILDNPYFNEEDTVSTKESDLEISTLNKSMISNSSEQKNPNPYKSQQNSYPFYASNKPQPKRPESNFSEIGAKNTPTFQSPYSVKAINYGIKPATMNINSMHHPHYYRKS